MIGADQRQRKFFQVVNERDFDQANLRQILEKYLDPLPIFDAWTANSDDGVTFALVVLPADQPRPIVIKADVQGADGSTYLLQKGDIWVKKNTGLVRATRADLEVIYETRIQAESDRRAERRIADVRSAMEATLRLQFSPERRIPSEDLVFGPDAEYMAYIEQLLANEDAIRFRMLMTTLRDLLVDKWDPVVASGSRNPVLKSELEERLSDHATNKFNPALRRLLYTGLILIKHGLNADWFTQVARLHLAVFSACSKIPAFPELNLRPPISQTVRTSTMLDVLLNARTLETYAIRRAQYELLSPLLQSYVSASGLAGRPTYKPFLFWPVQAEVPGNDRIAYQWSHTVQPYWLDFFASEKSFLDVACNLEFILHMNSYFACQTPEARRWLKEYRPDHEFDYWYFSDLWRYPLASVVPLAEMIYGDLDLGLANTRLLYISVEPTVVQKALASPGEPGYSAAKSKDAFVQYLVDLEGWRAKAALSSNRFASTMDWGPVLGPHVKKIMSPPKPPTG